MDEKLKKAQVSLFLIISILLLIVSIFILLLSSPDSQVMSGFQNNEIDNTVQACFNLELENALLIVGDHVGYIVNVPSIYIDNLFSSVPFWLYNGLYTGLTTQFVESEISKYIEYAIPACLNATLIQEIEVNDVKASTSIYDERIIVELNIDARIFLDNVEIRTGRYIADKDLLLGKMLSQARESIFEMIDVQGIPLSWISEQVLPTFIEYVDEGYLFSIMDYYNYIRDEPYMFYYGVSFEMPHNEPPFLEPIGPLTGYVGEEIYIEYYAEDDAYVDELRFSITTFEPYNDMQIDEITGIISYVPLIAGRYTAYVAVTDAEGLTDVDFLDIEVLER